MRRSIAPAVGVAAGVGIAAVATRRALARPDDFYATRGDGDEPWQAGTSGAVLPITYHRSEQVVSFHPISLEAARAVVPTDVLHPVRLPDGRAILAVSAARYLEGTAPGADPHDLCYGEVMVAVVVTRTPSPPLLPVVRAMLPGGGPSSIGVFLLHVAMTNRASRDVGRLLGFPAFVGDFAFEDGIEERRLGLSDDGRDILRLRTPSTGRTFVDRQPMTTYSVLADQLLQIVSACSGVAHQRLGRGAGGLELGEHPVAESIRALDPSADALVARSYLNLRLRIPRPSVVGTVRPYAGYAGTDREWGAYRIRYPDGSVIDLHAAGHGSGSTPPAASSS